MDWRARLPMTLGHTYIIGDRAPEPLSNHPIDLIVR
jgi:hypothetical protein